MLPKTVIKSSVVGERVAVEIGDGYYAPAIIKSVSNKDKHMSMASEMGDSSIYTACFDDGKSKFCTGEEIVGSHFKSITDIKLQPYQKVYTMHKGCEVSGYVLTSDGGKVKIQLPGFSEKEVVERTLNELYLFTNRWEQMSWQQQQQRTAGGTVIHQQDADLVGGASASAGGGVSETIKNSDRGRAVSASIKVPMPGGGSRVRKTSEEPTMTELIAAMVLSNLSCSPVIHNRHHPMLNNPQTNLGTSPHSLDSSGVGSWNSRHISPTRQLHQQQLSSNIQQQQAKSSATEEQPSDDDANMILMDRNTPTPINEDEGGDEMLQDEPQDLRVPRVNVQRPANESTRPIPFPVVLSNYPYYFPAAVPHPLATSLPPDFRFQLSSLPNPSVISLAAATQQQQKSAASSSATSSVTVKGHTSSSSSDGKKISQHRHHHRPAPYHKVSEEPSSAGTSPSSSKSMLSSQYYPFQSSPVPIASLSFSPTYHVKHSRSPTNRSSLSPSSQQQQAAASLKDRTSPLAIPNPTGGFTVYGANAATSSTVRTQQQGGGQQQQRIGSVLGTSGPISIATAKAFSWQNEAAFSPKSSIVHQRQQIHQLASPKMGFPISPKPMQIGRKVRGDGKKCRKVYGMERRDLWCTSCRWKKACQRFPD